MDLDRIKQNVAKMAAMNAPESDIDGYIASEGASLQDIQSHPLSDQSHLQATFEAKRDSDKLAAGLIRKVGSGGTFGTADEIGAGLEAGGRYAGAKVLQGADYINRQLGGDSFASPQGQAIIDQSLGDQYNTALASNRSDLAYAQKEAPIASAAAELGGALLTGGLGAGSGAANAIANGLRSGGLSARVAKGALLGATSGGLYGFGSGESDQRLFEAGTGAILGGVTGGALPVAGAAIKGTANAIVPKIDAATAQLAQKAIDAGIPLSVDQIAPSAFRNTIQKISQEIPFSGSQKFRDTQRQGVQKVVAKEIGQEADNLGPETIKNFYKENNTKFRGALKGQDVNFDNTAFSRFDDIISDSKRLGGSDTYNIVNTNIQKLKTDLGSGNVKAEKLADIRSSLAKDASNAEGKARNYLNEAIDVIDDITAKSLPEEQAALLSQARREYRNFKAIKPALKKMTDGTVNPQEVGNRVLTSKYIPTERLAVGEDALVDTARASKQFLPVKSGSDTAQKTFTLGAVLGGVGSLGTAGGLTAANRLFQSIYNRNPAIVQKIINKALKTGKVAPADIKGIPTQDALEILSMVKKLKPNQAEELQAVFEGRKLKK